MSISDSKSEVAPELCFTVPLIPPSVNHYWKHAVVKGQLHSYVTSDGKAFLEAVAICARRRVVAADLPTSKRRYAVTFRVFLGKGDKGDLANFEKAIGDGLAKAGVIHSDDAIDEYHQYKSRDWNNPRTEIEVSRR